MPRVAYQPLAQSVAAAVFAMLTLGVMLRVGAAQEAADTLPRHADVVAGSDSAALVRAASDALQGRSSVVWPMVTTSYRREGRTAVVSLRPATMRGIVFRNLGGTVRILGDGRRIILSRE